MLLDNYLGGKLNGRQKLYALFIVTFILLQCKCFNYYNWNITYGGWVLKIIYLYFLFIFIKYRNNNKNCHFKKETILLILLQFPSMINSWIYFNQSPMESFMADLEAFTFVTYFILHYYNVEERTILKAIFFISLMIVSIQLIQQFTYPQCWFGIYDQDKQAITRELAEQRNGLWRFRMHINGFYTCPVLFAAWIWLQKKFDVRLVYICGLLLVSIYLTLTRQVMVACIFAVVMSIFINKRKGILGPMLFCSLLFIALYSYYDVLFSTLASQTQNETTEDNIRLFSANYFWEESIRSPLTFLFGYGNSSYGSQYGNLIANLGENYGFYIGDVGFIGQIYQKGVLYVIMAYWMFYKIFFKLGHFTPTYIKTMVMFAVPMSPMIFGLHSPIYYFFWSMMIYICDLHINNSKLMLYQ